MQQKDQFDGETMYFYYRKKTATEKTPPISRERAAELLDVSFESLKAYESGKTNVPAKVVLKMCEVYNAPELRSFHCHYDCPIGKHYSPILDTSNLELDRLTLRLLSSFKAIANIKESLIEIAADGVISEDERPTLNEILKTLDAISLHTHELRVWVEKTIEK